VNWCYPFKKKKMWGRSALQKTLAAGLLGGVDSRKAKKPLDMFHLGEGRPGTRRGKKWEEVRKRAEKARGRDGGGGRA